MLSYVLSHFTTRSGHTPSFSMGLTQLIVFLLTPMLISGLTFTNVQVNTCPGGGMSFDVTGNTGPVTINWVPGGALGNNVTGLNPGTYTVFATDSLTTINYGLTIAGSDPILDPNWDTYSVSWDPLYATPHLGMYVDRVLDNDIVTSNVTSVVQGFGGTVVSQVWSSDGGIFDFPTTLHPQFFPYGDTVLTTLYLTTVTSDGCTEVFNISYGVYRIQPLVDVLQTPSVGGTNSAVLFDFMTSLGTVSQTITLIVVSNDTGMLYSLGSGTVETWYPHVVNNVFGAGLYSLKYDFPYPLNRGWRYLYFTVMEHLTPNIRTYTLPSQDPIISLDGMGPYTYSWIGSPLSDPSLANPGFLASTPTTYIVMITDALGRMGYGATTYDNGGVTLAVTGPDMCGQYILEGTYQGGVAPVHLVWSPGPAVTDQNKTYAKTTLIANTTIYYALTDGEGLVVTTTYDAVYTPPTLSFTYSMDGCYLLNVSLGDQLLVNNYMLTPGDTNITLATPCGDLTSDVIPAPYTCGYNRSKPLPISVGSLTPTTTTYDAEPLILSLVSLSEVVVSSNRDISDLVGYTIISTLDLESLPWHVYVLNYTCYDLVVSTAFYDLEGHNVTLRRYFPSQDGCDVGTGIVLNKTDIKYAFDVEAWPFTRDDSLLVLSTTYVFNGTKVTSPRIDAFNESLLYSLNTASGTHVTISHLTYAQVDDGLGNVTVILTSSWPSNQTGGDADINNGTIVAHIVFPHFARTLSYDPVLSLLLAASYKHYSYTYMAFTVGSLGIAAVVIIIVLLISLTEMGRECVYGAEGQRIKKLRKHMADNDITPDSDNIGGEAGSGG